MLKCYRVLEIYVSEQVDTLNKTLKLSCTSKVFAVAGRLFQIFTIWFPKKYFLTSTRL